LDTNKFKKFNSSVSDLVLPKRFSNPFYFEVNPLAMLAARELQTYIEQQHEWDYYFGLKKHQTIIGNGKMFGVLVVENKNKEIGYLAAYSGKLAYNNNHSHFVPPVFDMLEVQNKQDTFYQIGERTLYEMSEKISQLENAETFQMLKNELSEIDFNYSQELNNCKEKHRLSKKVRQRIREAISELPLHEQTPQLETLKLESIREHFELKDLKNKYRSQRENIISQIEQLQQEIDKLKEQRKRFSTSLQDRLFAEYHFLNARGERKNVIELFKNHFDGKPPAGAGECCAPKLLQYAYKNDMKPIAMAEFWWGKTPLSEIRHHKQFYPACKGKCLPILTHMLVGIELQDNPLQQIKLTKIHLNIIYEDEHLLAIDKPTELLSVPGKTKIVSVFDLLTDYLPKEIKPWMVHRLDMSTSGILLVAKNKDVYVSLQEQFARKTIKKRYIAIVDGLFPETKGTISMPLRVDLDDRPRQIVCFQYGKLALTQWEKIDEINGKTKLYFYPITGRTHQLRIHAAHHLGLNAPIVGDNLYGQVADRLYLHAERLIFTHPKTKKNITLYAQTPF